MKTSVCIVLALLAGSAAVGIIVALDVIISLRPPTCSVFDPHYLDCKP